ncbi:MAG: hypothetical protein R6X06_03595 [Gammaproteobacteria bacterium]
MKAITLYIDETLSTREMVKLMHDIKAMPHVISVEHPRHDKHDLTIEYEPHAGLPGDVLKALRSRGLHPDIISG